MEPLSPATLAFIERNLDKQPHTLALQASKYPEVDIRTAVSQIAGIQVAKIKIPSWSENKELRYPVHLSLEQCSSERTARYKASLIQGTSITDLTGGFGVDCAFMAKDFDEGHYVERQAALCDIASHNFHTLGLTHIQVHHADSVDYLEKMKPVDWIFIDPARRDSKGGKTVVIADCEPDVSQLEDLLLEKGSRVMIKLSPMLDLSLALNTLRHVTSAHIISVGNECKELLLIEDKEYGDKKPPVQITCINMTAKGEEMFCFTREEEQNSVCTYATALGKYLYEPNSSIMKGGAYKSIAQRFGLNKLHPNSHLYTSDTYLEEFPGRIFEIIDSCSFNKKELKSKLGSVKQANLAVRNFPTTVADIRKRIKLAEGGNVYLFATTLNNEDKVMIICRKTSG